MQHLVYPLLLRRSYQSPPCPRRSYFFHQIDAGLQIHPKIDEDPVYSLAFILFLFQHEHVVVEELLEFLVGKVDAQLLKAVVLEMKELGVRRKFLRKNETAESRVLQSTGRAQLLSEYLHVL